MKVPFAKYSRHVPGPSSESVRAELAAAGESVERYRVRLAELLERIDKSDDEGELVAAMWEAERGLLAAQRLLARAQKLAR